MFISIIETDFQKKAFFKYALAKKTAIWRFASAKILSYGSI